jgi:hypothetical protein
MVSKKCAFGLTDRSTGKRLPFTSTDSTLNSCRNPPQLEAPEHKIATEAANAKGIEELGVANEGRGNLRSLLVQRRRMATWTEDSMWQATKDATSIYREITC